jgi:L-asparaginase/Glu-tRNA(Gln) amidotransferase subunit D
VTYPRFDYFRAYGGLHIAKEREFLCGTNTPIARIVDRDANGSCRSGSPDLVPHLSAKVIYVLTTGGTIEKVYSENTGSVAILDSKIDRYLGLLRLPDCEVNVVPLMNKDGLEMTD